MKGAKIFDLSGRVAIVTGGSVGLGRQMAEALAEMGANLVLCGRKKERCQQAAAELEKGGTRSRQRKLDAWYRDDGRTFLARSIYDPVSEPNAQYGREDQQHALAGRACSGNANPKR